MLLTLRPCLHELPSSDWRASIAAQGHVSCPFPRCSSTPLPRLITQQVAANALHLVHSPLLDFGISAQKNVGHSRGSRRSRSFAMNPPTSSIPQHLSTRTSSTVMRSENPGDGRDL